MKALIINGSPKPHGSTSLILKKIEEGLSEKIKKIKTYQLGSAKINFCTGCQYCFTSKKCVQKDDVQKIIQDIYTSDIIIIGSPSYWGTITGQLKTFIDRCVWLSHTMKGGTSIPGGKYGVSIAVCEARSPKENKDVIEKIEYYFSHLEIKPLLSWSLEGIGKPGDLSNQPDKLDKAFHLGKEIIDKLK